MPREADRQGFAGGQQVQRGKGTGAVEHGSELVKVEHMSRLPKSARKLPALRVSAVMSAVSPPRTGLTPNLVPSLSRRDARQRPNGNTRKSSNAACDPSEASPYRVHLKLVVLSTKRCVITPFTEHSTVPSIC